MNRRSTRAKLHVLILTLLAAAFLAPGALAQDGVNLRVDPGALPGELSLTWTGGQPTFEIFRAATPENVVDPANKIGETMETSFVDTPPAGTLWFYVVTSPCVSDPPEVCDGVDNDCNGVVDDPGAESSCDLANATPSCVAGACAIDVCDAGFGDCDLDPVTGCEIDLDTDLQNCGGCGNVCSLANATPECNLGACEILACDTGFDDCDRTDANGCEVELANDPANCGSCGNACDLANASSTCNLSTCEIAACDAGFDDCDATAANGCEVDVATDPGNCGGCGIVCDAPNATSGCDGGSCTLAACDADFWDVNGDPADGCEYACVFVSAIDQPDDTLTDENCDGVDGDASDAIFVSPAGSDANPGTRDLPMATLGAALAEAEFSGRTQLLADTGTYVESIALVDGIGVYGGYDAANGWSRNGVDRSTILGGTTAVTANGLVSTTILEYLDIESADSSSGSSYGIFADGSPGLVVRHGRVAAGRGRTGVSGSPGGSGAPGSTGFRGTPGCENSSGFGCTTCSRPQGGNG